MATTTYDDARDGRETKRRPGRLALAIRVLIVLLVLGALGGGLWFFNNFKKHAIADFFAHNVPPPTQVTAAPARAGDQAQYLGGIGSLTAIRQVRVSPEVQGRVERIMFEPGADVHAGDPLVQLNDAPERADLANFEAQIKLAQANLERTQRLAKNDFATQSALDQNVALLEQAKAGVARTQALLDQKLVKAPFDGELGIREVEYGQYVGPGTNLVTLTDLDRIYVNFTVPEQTRGEVKIDQDVLADVDAYPGRSFEAKLTTIEPQIDPGTRTIRLQAKMDNPDHLLLPGMFANARIVLPPRPQVVTVPETAVTHTLYGDSVFVVRDGGKDGAAGGDGKAPDGKAPTRAEQVFVRTGDVVNGRIAILEGVKPGDLVVSSGQLKLQPGAPVKVASEQALPIPAKPPLQ